MWLCCVGRWSCTCIDFHQGSAMEIVINLVAVVFFSPFIFWLKCKCKFAHESDGSCNTQQTIFHWFWRQRQGKNRIPSPLARLLFFYFLARIFLENYFIGKTSAISPAHNLMHHANFNQLNECNIFLFNLVYYSLAHYTAMLHKHNMRVVKREDKHSAFKLEEKSTGKFSLSCACDSRFSFNKMGIKWLDGFDVVYVLYP